MTKDNIAYALGKRASKISAEGMPMDDEVFMNYVEKDDPPLVQAMQDYCEGFEDAREASNTRAIGRRAWMVDVNK
jgi:hypothetical protein